MYKNFDIAETEKTLALRDILRFFKYHAWTHDPRPGVTDLYGQGIKGPLLPFLLFPFQEEAVLKIKDHIDTGQDLLIEKSRDMGVTWLVVSVILWFFLQPTAGNDFLLGSRKFDYVDKKDSQDTIFEKFRYNLYRLHPVFMPEGFTVNRNDRVAAISNPQTQSYIHGESNNANFGTSGRYKAIFPDEFAKWEETDALAWTSMGDSSPCRLPVSTPWGMGRKFAQLKFSGAIEILRLHWSQHPIKSAGLYYDEEGNSRSPWYDEECERRKDDPTHNIGQELDINYLTSGTPYFDNQSMSDRYQAMVKDLVPAIRYEFERIGEAVRLREHPQGKIFINKIPAIPKIYKAYRYIISADVAEGLEKGDFSVFYVYDRVAKEDVAWFQGHCDTDVFALLLYHFSKMYDDAYIAVENNNHGHAVVQKLKTLTAKLMYEKDFTQFIDLDKVKLGWNTNMVTRPIMCSDLREAITQEVDGILDVEFFNEALTFILNKNGKPEAEAGNNYDDRVMAQAIKFQLHKWLPAPVLIPRDPWADHGFDDHGKLGHDRRIPVRGKGAKFV